MIADHARAFEASSGDRVPFEADPPFERDPSYGFSRYRDAVTQSLGLLASTWDSLHKAWQATEKRAAYGAPHLQKSLGGLGGSLKKLRDQTGAQMVKEMKKHPLWPWLETHSGVRGVHVARVISMIGDPLRFPGRVCHDGHHVPEDWSGPCPLPVSRDGAWVACGLPVGLRRPGSGTKALWHYLGVHVVDGHLARKRKGVQCTWHTAGRTALLQPDGVADQIIKQRVRPWRSVYDAKKESVLRERVAEGPCAIVKGPGAAPAMSSVELEGGPEPATALVGDHGPSLQPLANRGAGKPREAEMPRGSSIRPFQIHSIARTVAVKAFVADLLTAWKAAIEVPKS